MISNSNSFIFIVAILFTSSLMAQESNDQVRETVTVVKSYNPEIEPSKKQPLSPEKPNFKKNTEGSITYKITTFPVLKTYIPKFAAPYLHWVSPLEDEFSTLIHLAAGNNSKVNFDLSHNQYVSSNFNYGIRASYNRIAGTLSNNVFSPFNENIFLGSSMGFSSSKGDGKINLHYSDQFFNYYGLEQMIGLSPSSTAVDQRYKRVGVTADYNFNRGVVQKLKFNLKNISDITSSSELGVNFIVDSSFDLSDRRLMLQSSLDYLSGGFENASLTQKANLKPDPYDFMELELKPQLQHSNGKLDLLVGVDVNYLSQTSADEVGVNLYPAIDATYSLSKDVMLVGGLNGNTQLNSFESYTQLNPYLSPTLEIKPSYTQFDFDFGLQANSGKFLNLELNASLSRVKDKALMMLNYQNYFRSEQAPYLNTNLKTFHVVYDRVDQMSINGSFVIRPSDNISVKSGISYSKFKTLNEAEAWNMPNLKAYGTLNAKLSESWMLSANLNYIGTRKDRYVTVVEFIMPGEYPEVIYDLEAFMNMSASLYYQYSDNWSFELKAENITNNQYQMWYMYPDLGAKISLGVQYRFDL